jgi:rhodanese-related sulfurtransferase
MKKSVIIIVGVLLLSCPGWAITPLELHEKMLNNDALTLIDIRGTSLYQTGHIPGAINIPASVIAMKRLPQFESVIIYGDGIRTDITRQAADELGLRQGLSVAVLEGGFSAWQSLNLNTTHEKGIARTPVEYLTYQAVKQMAQTDKKMVLVDLRKRAGSLTNLSDVFPGMKVVRMVQREEPSNNRKPFKPEAGKLETRREKRHESLYILIDDGNGESETAALRLKAAGVGRLAILTGGEHALVRGGLPGEKTTRKAIDTRVK